MSTVLEDVLTVEYLCCEMFKMSKDGLYHGFHGCANFGIFVLCNV